VNLTIHLLTKNNEKTIKSTLQSICQLDADISVLDLGSTDDTLKICETFKTKISKIPQMNRSEAKNYSINLSQSNMQMFLEPWETLISGHESINKISSGDYNCTVVNGPIVNYEVRFWSSKAKFLNPVFE